MLMPVPVNFFAEVGIVYAFQHSNIAGKAVIALLVFGPKKLPELGKGIGDGIRGFKTAMKGDDAPSKPLPTDLSKDRGPTVV